MSKLKMHSPDLTSANIDRLAALFPNCVTETRDEKGQLRRAVDFDLLRQELSGELVEGPVERYTLNWPGKREAIVAANSPVFKTLRPCEGESVDFDTTNNLYIEGDNLEVLKLLQETYLGKVKMIYIDPPYNTGNDFIYRDRFIAAKHEYELAIEYRDEEGDIQFRQNNDTNPRFHSDWCSMMYSRLRLANNLLHPNGVIFISVDDNEVHNLRKICDEVFSSENFVNMISVKMKNVAGASGGGEDKRLKKNMEYILAYSKNYFEMEPFQGVFTYTPVVELIEQYRESDVSWKYTTALVYEGSKVYVGSTQDGDGSEIKIFKREGYDIQSISTLMKKEHLSEKEVYDKYASCIFQTAMPQSSIRPRVMDKVKELGISCDLYSIEYVPKSGRNKGVTYEQFYKGEAFRLFAWLRDVTEEVDGQLCKKDLQGTFWDFVGETKNLTREGDVPFPNGKKPLELLKRMVGMQTDKEAIILDFFSGSATTAHAVMQLNAEDGGNRRFIMVQLPEVCEEKSEAFKAGFKNICEIGKERIRRAGQKIKEENATNAPNLDVGFRVFKVDSSNMKDVYYTPDATEQAKLDLFADAIKEDRTAEDLLFQVILDCGIDLALPVAKEKVGGKTVFVVDQNVLVACFASDIPESLIRELAKRKPLKAVFLDRSFAKDSTKLNVTQIFKQLSPATEVKTL